MDLCGHGIGDDKAPSADNSMEAILLTTQLKEEIAQLKRQLDTRDRSIIEKGRVAVVSNLLDAVTYLTVRVLMFAFPGKQYNELKTEMWEADKKLKKRLNDQAQDHERRLEGMEVGYCATLLVLHSNTLSVT